jgi:hypothetical protein
MRRTSSEGSNLVERRNWTGILAVLSSTCVALMVSSCELPEDDAAQPEEQQAPTRVDAPIALLRTRANDVHEPRHTTSFSDCRRRHVPHAAPAPNRASIPAKGSSAKAAVDVRVPAAYVPLHLCDHVPVLQSASRCCRRATSWRWRSTPFRNFCVRRGGALHGNRS